MDARTFSPELSFLLASYVVGNLRGIVLDPQQFPDVDPHRVEDLRAYLLEGPTAAIPDDATAVDVFTQLIESIDDGKPPTLMAGPPDRVQ